MINKNTILSIAFAFISTVNVYAAKGHGTSDAGEALAPPDVSKENGMYFFCEDEFVIIQNCEGKATKPGKGCEGAEKRTVGKYDFFLELRNGTALKIDPSLLGMNKDEMGLFRKMSGKDHIVNYNYLKEQIKERQELMSQLRPIDEKKKEIDEVKRDLVLLEKLLNKKEVEVNAITFAVDKLNKKLNEIVDTNICDSTVTHNPKSGSLLDELLKQYDPKPVAKKETLANGMLELAKREVGADAKNRNFWKDTTTGLTWGPVEDGEKVKELQKKLKLTFKYDGKEHPDYLATAVEYCKTLGMELPSQKDFLDALLNPESEKNKDKGFGYGQNIALKDNLPDMEDRFWSSSPHPSYADCALGFSGNYGRVFYGHRSFDYYSVRCVSRGGR